MSEKERIILTGKEVRKELNIPNSKLRFLTDAKVIPFIKLGNRLLFHKTKIIEAYIKYKEEVKNGRKWV